MNALRCCSGSTLLQAVSNPWSELQYTSAWTKSSFSMALKQGIRCNARNARHVSPSEAPRLCVTMQSELSRRTFLEHAGLSLAPIVWLQLNSGRALAEEMKAAVIDASTAPREMFDTLDPRYQEASEIFRAALNAPTVTEEERLWTKIIDTYGGDSAKWTNDVVSRAWGNRGNARARMGRLEESLQDYNQSIALAPYAVDPVLNRGVALEALGRYPEAARDYEAVLKAEPDDPSAWNNLGNVKAAQGEWNEALTYYQKAARLAPDFSFASANYAVTLYQVGRKNEAIKGMRTLLRRYPEFPDMRAALAVSLYAEGLTAEAETNWQRLEDLRYKDRKWVRSVRKWPPRLVDALERFLDVGPQGSK